MNFLDNIFNKALYQPLLNALVFLYQFFPGNDLGIAVIVLTVLVRLFLLPFTLRALESQKKMTILQKRTKEIQEREKDKEKQLEEIMNLYKEEKVNPFDSIAPILIQLSLLVGLYRVLLRGFGPEALVFLYSFIKPLEINMSFLGLIDLSVPNLPLAVIAGIMQFVQFKTMPQDKDNKEATKIMGPMSYFMSIIIFTIVLRMPSIVGLYIVTTTIFTIGQQYLLDKKYK
ncbi:MAG: YidC/Oxa1 family membrane protein insertase [Patescibacteria group bacterium]